MGIDFRSCKTLEMARLQTWTQSNLGPRNRFEKLNSSVETIRFLPGEFVQGNKAHKIFFNKISFIQFQFVFVFHYKIACE